MTERLINEEEKSIGRERERFTREKCGNLELV